MQDALIPITATNAALNRRDVDAMLVHYDPDATVVDHRQVAFGTFNGVDELRTLYTGIVSSTTEFHEALDVLHADDEHVVAHAVVTAQLAADPNGHVTGAEYGYVATVRDGLVASLELYDTGADALAAFRG